MKITIFFVLLYTSLVYAQQDPHYTQYMYNQNIINPAYAGSGGNLNIGLLARTQWVGISGAPDTQTFNIHSIISKGLGLGLSFVSDQIGPAKEQSIMLDASYALPVGEKSTLAFGLKGNYNFLKVNLLSDEIVMNDEGDILFYKDINKNAPNIGAGIFFNTDRFYTGIAIPNLMENKILVTRGNGRIQNITDKRHLFGTIGYVFDLSENLKFKPSTMVKIAPGAPISIDLNGSLYINNKFEIGLSLREGDSIDGLFGLQVSPQFRVGYAYDYTINNLGNFNSGSHEIMLLYSLNFEQKQMKSPRFF